MGNLPEKTRVRLAVLAGCLLVLTTLLVNIGDEYIRGRMEGIKRKAYFEDVISGKGLSLKEARHWKRLDKEEKQGGPVIK